MTSKDWFGTISITRDEESKWAHVMLSSDAKTADDALWGCNLVKEVMTAGRTHAVRVNPHIVQSGPFEEDVVYRARTRFSFIDEPGEALVTVSEADLAR